MAASRSASTECVQAPLRLPEPPPPPPIFSFARFLLRVKLLVIRCSTNLFPQEPAMRISCRHFVCFHAIPCNSSARCAGFSAKRSVGSRLRLRETFLFAILFLCVDSPHAWIRPRVNSFTNNVVHS